MPPASQKFILAILVVTASLAMVSASLPIPSLPGMAEGLGVPLSDIQRTVTAYTMGFGFSTLAVGPLSDRYGRRTILLGGTALCVMASLWCTFAVDLPSVYIARFLQAIGASTCYVASRTIIPDVFRREETARAMSHLSMAVSIVPVLVPVLGGWVQMVAGWRMNFALIAIVGALTFSLQLLRLPETNLNLRNEAPFLRSITSGYGVLLRQRAFLGYGIAASSGVLGFYGMLSAAPALLINHFGLTPAQCGYFLALPAIGFFISAWINTRFVAVLGLTNMIRIGGIICLCAAGLAAFLAPIDKPWIMLGPILLLGFSNGLVMPNANAASVNVNRELAGTASGMVSFLQMGLAAVATLVLASVRLDTAWPFAALFAISGCVSLIGTFIARPSGNS